MPFYAHSLPGAPVEKWQLLNAHLTATADRAGLFASHFNSGEWGRLCGLLHDLGKYSDAFQKRLNGKGPRVDHSLAGALEAIRFLDGRHHAGVGKLAAHVISAHHTGLADGVSQGIEGKSLTERLRAQDTIPPYSAWAADVALPPLPPLPSFPAASREALAFSLGFWTRMLYSCLVDADFLDTESFVDAERGAARGEYPSLDALHAALERTLAIKSAAAAPNMVNAERAKVPAACREAADLDQGFFSLTVPTGGGKTLSSLAFALAHARRHNLRRVIYVIPYTSIIEQTAEVFRQAFGPALEHAVLEHHSNAVEKLEKQPENADEHEFSRVGQHAYAHTLAFENWDAPVIVTTAVQFFESLFAARSSQCRKLHNIAESVVILDEAQTLPTHLLRPCLSALKELTASYRASVVLCTATQPEVGVKPWNRSGLENVREIMPDAASLFHALERVEVNHIGPLQLEALAGLVGGHDRALCIVNTGAQARDLCELLHARGKPVFHLSTWMCPAHRKNVLCTVKNMLLDRAAPPVLLIATSLLEAGVDIDFPVAFRAMSGLDSIAQAAGRCNREGGQARGQVYVFELPETPKGEQQRRQGACRAVLRQGLPLLSLEGTSCYFDALYSLAGENGLDRHNILGRITENAEHGLFPFRSVARDFALIDTHDLPLIILYGDDARAAVQSLRGGLADRALHRRLQQWVVTLPEKALNRLIAAGVAEPVGHAAQYHVLTNEDIYAGMPGRTGAKPAMGLDLRDPVFLEVERQIF